MRDNLIIEDEETLRKNICKTLQEELNKTICISDTLHKRKKGGLYPPSAI